MRNLETAGPYNRRERTRGYKTALLLGFKVVLASALMWWLIASGRLEWQVLARLEFRRELLALFVCRIAILGLQMIRWQRLVTALDLKLSAAQALHIGLISSFFGMFAPASLGSDGARLYYATRENEGHAHELISTIFMDRLTGLIALMTMAIGGGLLLLLFRPEAALSRLILLTAAVLAAGGLIAGFAALKFPRMLDLLRGWQPVQRVLAGVWRYRLRKRALAEAMILSWISHSFFVASAWFAFVALDFRPPLFIVCAVTPLVGLSYGIPLTPMGLGVMDTIGDALYQVLGVDGGAEVTLVLRASLLLVSAISGLAFLFPVFRSRLQPMAVHEDA